MVYSVMQQEILYQRVLYFQTDARSQGTRVNVLSTDTHNKVRPSLRRYSLNLHMLNPITRESPTGLQNSTHVSETERGRQDRNYFTPFSKVGRYLSLHRFSWSSPLLNRIGQIYDICMSLKSFKTNAKCGLKCADAHLVMVSVTVRFSRNPYLLSKGFAKNSDIEFLKTRQAVQSLTLGPDRRADGWIWSPHD